MQDEKASAEAKVNKIEDATYIKVGRTQIKIIEHFADKGKPLGQMLEDMALRAATAKNP